MSIIDQNYNSFLESERSLPEFSERMLIGVASKYGKNSDEYEIAGGVRRRERKRVIRRTEEKTTPTLMAVTENSSVTSQMQ